MVEGALLLGVLLQIEDYVSLNLPQHRTNCVD